MSNDYGLRIHPPCRTQRGYDTDVKVEPNHDNERFRTLTVRCTLHDHERSATIHTAGKNGDEIQQIQEDEFYRLFAEVEAVCDTLHY
jgi:hypothetical protein